MTTYLLNAFSTTMLPAGGVVEFTNLYAVHEATDVLSDGFESAVGHQGTAVTFSQLLKLPVKARRVQITLAPGDWAVIGQINARLPEGKVLSGEELRDLPIRWVLAEVKREEERELPAQAEGETTVPIEKEFEAYSRETVDRFLDLTFRLCVRGAITDEVEQMAMNAASTVSCAVNFPTLKWDGAIYLVKQDDPANYEAL